MLGGSPLRPDRDNDAVAEGGFFVTEQAQKMLEELDSIFELVILVCAVVSEGGG
ncbi:MAG: hypothetical protein U9N12_07135 [Euryarchaeota archaeon]|nr:hypothetical protein [Euryarchaeota archaeon]